MLKSTRLALFASWLVAGGCTSTHYIANLQEGELPALHAGQTVQVTLKSGEFRMMKVETVDSEKVAGFDLNAHDPTTRLQIALADVQSMETRKLPGLGNAAIVVAVVVTVVLIVSAL